MKKHYRKGWEIALKTAGYDPTKCIQQAPTVPASATPRMGR